MSKSDVMIGAEGADSMNCLRNGSSKRTLDLGIEESGHGESRQKCESSDVTWVAIDQERASQAYRSIVS